MREAARAAAGAALAQQSVAALEADKAMDAGRRLDGAVFLPLQLSLDGVSLDGVLDRDEWSHRRIVAAEL
eukprot:CAMPEP_0118915794 /NCGR_PEP_ID=MMETSP1166-20130328/15908_1 /TAXON_ID=1104430 /ORGANISM="Chrysoreinhardia sp, Strain CCMP3193" /LENGTH=69 /DNA_ID=CAMNT_0006855541 /DNA_START=573 /DNA_END=778 /DNA_ORIENTATION=-